MTRTAFVSVGTNVDRCRNLRSAIAALRGRFEGLRLSPVYESPAEGFDGAPFYNLVAELHTGAALADVVQALRAIEERHGRRRGEDRFASRTLDLDLLTFGSCCGTFGEVTLPRDDITRYAFVLRPLSELSPEARHPVLGATYAELWEAFRGEARLSEVSLSL